jgi:hypothetical protein
MSLGMSFLCQGGVDCMFADKTLGNVPAVGIKLYWTTTYSLVATWWKRTAQGQVGRISTEQILPIVKDRFWMAVSLTCLAIDRYGDHGDVISAWSFFALIAGNHTRYITPPPPHQSHHQTHRPHHEYGVARSHKHHHQTMG